MVLAITRVHKLPPHLSYVLLCFTNSKLYIQTILPFMEVLGEEKVFSKKTTKVGQPLHVIEMSLTY